MRELIGWVLVFAALASGPAIGVALTLFARRQSRSRRADDARPPTSMLEGDTPLPPPPRTPVFAPSKTTGVRSRTEFAPHVPPSDGLALETWLLSPFAPERPTETHPETPPGAPDESWSGRGGSFGGAGASGFYGVAEAPPAPAPCDAAVSNDSASSCGGTDGSD